MIKIASFLKKSGVPYGLVHKIIKSMYEKYPEYSHLDEGKLSDGSYVLKFNKKFTDEVKKFLLSLDKRISFGHSQSQYAPEQIHPVVIINPTIRTAALTIIDPNKTHIDWAVDAIKRHLDVKGKPIMGEFLTYREGNSNKFHMFVIFKDGVGDHFVGANAHGRIGNSPITTIITEGDKNSVMRAVNKKIQEKISKGYERHPL